MMHVHLYLILQLQPMKVGGRTTTMIPQMAESNGISKRARDEECGQTSL